MRTKLRFPNTCLRELPDLSPFLLEEVDIQGNRLSCLEHLPISLKSLNASHNYISNDGIFYPFPNCKYLNLSHNCINIYNEDDFVFCYPSLETVILSYNLLRHTGFLRDSSVEILDVSHNRIPILAGLPQSVKHLIADTNEIKMIQSKLPPLLEILEFSYNSLRFAGLPLNWPTTLRELHLDHNCIEKFPRRLPDSLEVLTLNENTITELPASLPEHLHSFSINSNKIRFLPNYSNHKRFHVFLIENNCLTSLPYHESLATVFSAQKNWNEQEHHTAQRKIQQCWKRYYIQIRLRHFLRLYKYKSELFEISMMPERWAQVDTLDPSWFRKS